MNILFFDFFPFVGGAEMVVLRLAEGLRQAGCHPHMCVPDGSLARECEARHLPLTSIPFVPIPSRKPWNYVSHFVNRRRATVALNRLCETVRPNVVHAAAPISAWYALAASRRQQVPIILHLQDILEPNRVNRMLVATVKDTGIYVAAASQAVRERALQLGLDAEKVVCIHAGIDVEQWQSGAAAEPRVRRETGTPKDAIVFLTVGQLAPWKGVDVFVRAAREVAAKTAHFWIVGASYVGDRTFDAQLRQLAAVPELRLRVHFLGRRDDIADVMREADTLVQPSVQPDPFPTSIMEAMALGRPVIGTRLGGIPEMLDDGREGSLVSPGDVKSLAEAMQQMAADGALRQRLGTAARERAERQFTLSRCVNEFMDLYRQASLRSTTQVT